MLAFSEFQERAGRTAMYPGEVALEYLALGLASEAGEVAGKIKKLLRGDQPPPSMREIAHEIGDVLWYAAELASAIGWELEEVAQVNLERLADRHSRGVIKGSGDDR